MNYVTFYRDSIRCPASSVSTLLLPKSGTLKENRIAWLTMNMHNETATNETSVFIPVIEEQVKIEKAIVETGAVKITKSVAESHETVHIPLHHDEHSITHIPINVFVDDIPTVRYEGETIIIPVLKEVLVKRTLLVEEIRISKHVIETMEQQTVTLRKENVSVDHIQSNNVSK